VRRDYAKWSPETWREVYASTLPRTGGEMRGRWLSTMGTRLPPRGQCPCSLVGLACCLCPEGDHGAPCGHGMVWEQFVRVYPEAAHQALVDYIRGVIP